MLGPRPIFKMIGEILKNKPFRVTSSALGTLPRPVTGLGSPEPVSQCATGLVKVIAQRERRDDTGIARGATPAREVRSFLPHQIVSSSVRDVTRELESIRARR